MEIKERYREYARLAWFYDRYWGAEYHRMILPVLEKLLFPAIPRDSRILDLCCGAGHLTAQLAYRGYRMTGIDGSEEMLAFARERAPGAQFLAADARSFHLPPRFEAAVSTFESMNHILSGDELGGVFANVLSALASPGIFLFDVLTEEAYSTLWGKSSAIVEEDNVCILRGGYDPRGRTGRSEITLFRLEGYWQRSDVKILQRCYALSEIVPLLDKAGFSSVSCHDCRKDLGLSGDLALGRIFISARKAQKKFTLENAESAED